MTSDNSVIEITDLLPDLPDELRSFRMLSLIERWDSLLPKIKDYIEIDVKTQTLDNFCSENKINYIHLLKLDTEGNEFNILKGAENLLSKNKIKIIYTEICSYKKDYNNKSNDIKKFLKKYNFDHIKSYKIPSLSFLSKLKATDDLFVFKKI